MNAESIINPNDFINAFVFHDVRIDRINIDFDAQTAELVAEDLNWNYEGSHGYIQRPCTLRFLGVSSYFIDLIDLEGIRIDDMKAELVSDEIQVFIYLNLGGGKNSWGSERSSLSLVFRALEIVDA